MTDAVHAHFTFKDFPLEGGGSLAEVTLAYVTRGRPAGDGRNAILVTHGYNIVSATGLNPDPGDMLIVAPAFRVGYKVIGELSAGSRSADGTESARAALPAPAE